MNFGEALALSCSLNKDNNRITVAIKKLLNSYYDEKVIIDAVRSSKVQTQFYENLFKQKIPGSEKLLELLKEDYYHSKKQIKTVRTAIKWIEELTNKDHRTTLLKGAFISRLYGNSVRVTKDLDILLESPSNLWGLTSSMRQEGLMQKEAWFCSRRIDKEEPWFITGHWKKEFDGNSLRIDLHSGVYSMLFLQSMKIPSLESVTVSYPESSKLFTLNPEATLLLLIAHAHSHEELRIRDLNDTYLILKNFPNMDFEWINEQINVNALNYVAQDLLEWTFKIYPELNQLNIPILIKNNKKNNTWPKIYHPVTILKHCLSYGYINGGVKFAVKEATILTWSNFVSKKISSNLGNSKNNIINNFNEKISSFRLNNIPYFYLSCPSLLSENISILNHFPNHFLVLEKVTELGINAYYDKDLSAIICNFEQGVLFICECGLFISSNTLLFEEDLYIIATDLITSLIGSIETLKGGEIKWHAVQRHLN